MGLTKDGVQAAFAALARWPGGLELGLYVTVPSWDAEEVDGVPGLELDVQGYARRAISLGDGIDHGDAVVTASMFDIDFGPFQSEGEGGVTVEGWGIWASQDLEQEPANILLAAGRFFDDDMPALVNVPDGMQLRVASNELMIGIGPVERLAG